MGAFVLQTNPNQRIRIIYSAIRIGDNTVGADILIHVILPRFIRRFFKNLDFLSLVEAHIISPRVRTMWLLWIYFIVLDDGCLFLQVRF